jgi:hypothetical protein
MAHRAEPAQLAAVPYPDAEDREFRRHGSVAVRAAREIENDMSTEIHRTQNVCWLLGKHIAELEGKTTPEDVSNIVDAAFAEARAIDDGFVNSTPSTVGGYFLDQDQSSHWYIVPRAHETEWQAWCELDEDDPKAWDAPEWAVRLGGGPNSVTFTAYSN